MSKPPLGKDNPQIRCIHCGYFIKRPYPTNQRCPKCNKFVNAIASSSKIFGKRKKKKATAKSLDADRIYLKGGNEYVKFCGIITVDRAPLFMSNRKLSYLLELTANLDYFATFISGGDLEKLLFESENGETEKCLFLEQNDLIYVIYGDFPDKKGKWILEQMAKYFSVLVQGKAVNKLKKFDKYDIEKKFKGYLTSIFKENVKFQDITDQEIADVEDLIRIKYVRFTNNFIRIISILLDDEEVLNVFEKEKPNAKGPYLKWLFEFHTNEKEKKESVLGVDIESFMWNMLSNTGIFLRSVIFNVGFQHNRFLTFRKYKNGYFLFCLYEGNLGKLGEMEDELEILLEPVIGVPFSGHSKKTDKLKVEIVKYIKEKNKKNNVKRKSAAL